MKLGKWIGLAALIGSAFLLWQLRQVLLVIFAAVAFATAINKLVQLLEKRGLKRGWAVALVLALLVVVLLALVLIIVPAFSQQFQTLMVSFPEGIAQLRKGATWLQTLVPEEFAGNVSEVLDNAIREVQTLLPRLLRGFLGFFSNSLDVILNVLLVLALSVMLLATPDKYRDGFIQLFPAFYRGRVDDILVKCEEALGGWFAGILFNMGVITVLSGLSLWALQVPLPLANALFAGLLTFIPNIGPVISVIPPIVLALTDEPWKAVAVLILYIVIQQVEGLLLTPLVMERQVSLLPAVTLISQVLFASLFGIAGLFLALPLVVVFQVWLRELVVKDILDRWQDDRSEV